MSLLPYENPSASYQRQLKTQKRQQAAADVSEVVPEDDVTLNAVSAAAQQEAGKDSESPTSASAGTSAAEESSTATKTSQDTKEHPSESLDKK